MYLFIKVKEWQWTEPLSACRTSSNTAKHTVNLEYFHVYYPHLSEPSSRMANPYKPNHSTHHHWNTCQSDHPQNKEQHSFIYIKVALSRVRTLEGLSLETPLTKEQVCSIEYKVASLINWLFVCYKLMVHICIKWFFIPCPLFLLD